MGSGQVTVPVADIDLIKLELQVVLASVEALVNASGLYEIPGPTVLQGNQGFTQVVLCQLSFHYPLSF